MDVMGWYIIVIVAGYFLFRFAKKIKPMLLNVSFCLQNRIFMLKTTLRKKFACHSGKKNQLSIEQIKILSVGLIIAEQHRFYTNTLATGLKKSFSTEELKVHWGITSTETALAYLNNVGLIWQHYDNEINEFVKTTATQTSPLVNLNIGGISTTTPYLNQAIGLFYVNQLVDNKIEMNNILQRGTIGWHLGKLIFVSRLSYEAGYISEEQAWSYIEQTFKKMRKHFTNWKQFGQSYLLGRLMWSNDDMAVDLLINIYKTAITLKKSPWIKYPL